MKKVLPLIIAMATIIMVYISQFKTQYKINSIYTREIKFEDTNINNLNIEITNTRLIEKAKEILKQILDLQLDETKYKIYGESFKEESLFIVRFVNNTNNLSEYIVTFDLKSGDIANFFHITSYSEESVEKQDTISKEKLMENAKKYITKLPLSNVNDYTLIENIYIKNEAQFFFKNTIDKSEMYIVLNTINGEFIGFTRI